MAASASSSPSGSSSSSSSSAQRFRLFVFTINNWTEDDLAACRRLADAKPGTYVIVGRETGESGTPHLQGAVYRALKLSRNFVREHLPRAYVDQGRGTPTQAFAYCMKEGDFDEFNPESKPVGQGKRMDLLDLFEHKSKRMSTVTAITTGVIGSGAALRTWNALSTHQPCPFRHDIRVLWLYGDSGVGKSRLAAAIAEASGQEVHWQTHVAGWWDGIDTHHRWCVIDDWEPESLPPAALLRVLDRYPLRLNVKGASVPTCLDRIIVTSCAHPSAGCHARWDELCRRLSSTGRDERYLIHVTPSSDAEASVNVDKPIPFDHLLGPDAAEAFTPPLSIKVVPTNTPYQGPTSFAPFFATSVST